MTWPWPRRTGSARLHGASLLDQYKDTAAAERIAAGFDEVKAKGDARDLRRMQALWQYNQIPVGNKGNQVSAQIYSKERVDVDGSGAKTVQLVFRDHPEWKRHAYLVLQAGDFRCPQCTVKVTVDDGKPVSMAAWRPKTDEAIALFITDQKALWKLARKGRSISIEFPVKAGGTARRCSKRVASTPAACRSGGSDGGGGQRSARVVRDPALGVRHGWHADRRRA